MKMRGGDRWGVQCHRCLSYVSAFGRVRARPTVRALWPTGPYLAGLWPQGYNDVSTCPDNSKKRAARPPGWANGLHDHAVMCI